MTVLLDHTQVARATKDGDIRKAVMPLVHKKCKEYVAESSEYWSVARFNRFRSHVADMYVATLRDPRDKNMRDDPTGETALRNIMSAVSA